MNYKHLTINERVVISQLKSSGYSIRKIAKFLDRSPSTISRELKRNSIQKHTLSCAHFSENFPEN